MIEYIIFLVALWAVCFLISFTVGFMVTYTLTRRR